MPFCRLTRRPQFKTKAGRELKNGELLTMIDGRFDVSILGDKNLRYQQNLAKRKIAIVEIYTIRWPHLQPFIPAIVAAVDPATSGSYVIVEPSPANDGNP